MKPRLSVIVPVFNERNQIVSTLEAAASELAPWFDAECIVVDDGSTDGTAAAVEASGVLRVRVIRQANQGRLGARRAGLKAAKGDYVLFLDSRVRLNPGSAEFLSTRMESGEGVWNAHVDIETAGNPYGRFWAVLTELAFAKYFDEPRTASYGLDEFDHFPKGTTCFFAPTELMRRAFTQFRTRYSDERNANDDTPILRWLAGQQRINISPRFSCRYSPRSTMVGFLRHAEHRGVVFVDGHGRPESRFFPAVVAFYPLSMFALAITVRRPLTALGLLAAAVGCAGGLAAARGKRPEDVLAFATLLPVYATAHGLGMWKGLALMLTSRFGGSRTA
jgi:glycosyltransferase involved in cell wall biosynthesis